RDAHAPVGALGKAQAARRAAADPVAEAAARPLARAILDAQVLVPGAPAPGREVVLEAGALARDHELLPRLEAIERALEEDEQPRVEVEVADLARCGVHRTRPWSVMAASRTS